jgi:hypothetical protein
LRAYARVSSVRSVTFEYYTRPGSTRIIGPAPGLGSPGLTEAARNEAWGNAGATAKARSTGKRLIG